MVERDLFDPDGPAVSVLAATPFTVANHLLAWAPAYPASDVLRGQVEKTDKLTPLMGELAAALQFPYYFGQNWDAVWDCITDLNWLKGSSFLTVFDSAEHLLSESDRGFEVLLKMLIDAHGRWHRETADFSVRGRRPIAFQSVLACAPEHVDSLIQRLDAVGSTFTPL